MNFDGIGDIVAHIEAGGPASRNVWIAREYSVADLVADLLRISGRPDTVRLGWEPDARDPPCVEHVFELRVAPEGSDG